MGESDYLGRELCANLPFFELPLVHDLSPPGEETQTADDVPNSESVVPHG